MIKGTNISLIFDKKVFSTNFNVVSEKIIINKPIRNITTLYLE